MKTLDAFAESQFLRRAQPMLYPYELADMTEEERARALETVRKTYFDHSEELKQKKQKPPPLEKWSPNPAQACEIGRAAGLRLSPVATRRMDWALRESFRSLAVVPTQEQRLKAYEHLITFYTQYAKDALAQGEEPMSLNQWMDEVLETGQAVGGEPVGLMACRQAILQKS